jgi:hypothetical protein
MHPIASRNPFDKNVEIDTANRHTKIRNALPKQSETITKLAQPKKLKGKNKKDW